MSLQINSNVPGARSGAGSARNMRLQLGYLVATRAVDRHLMSHPEGRAFVMSCLGRHERGDWGDLSGHDAEANDLAMVTGARVLSSFLIPEQIRRAGGDPVAGDGQRGRIADERLWVITEAEDGRGERLQTTVLFPSDY